MCDCISKVDLVALDSDQLTALLDRVGYLLEIALIEALQRPLGFLGVRLPRTQLLMLVVCHDDCAGSGNTAEIRCLLRILQIAPEWVGHLQVLRLCLR